jgi:YVTN family beta-propeller protein
MFTNQFFKYFLFTISLLLLVVKFSYAQHSLKLIKEIKGSISPKSIVYNGNGIFSAQNMMYRHTVTLYSADGELISTIKDKSDLNSYGFEEYKSKTYMGGPVEACFSNEGKYLWVSNYSMVGAEFDKEGCDACIGDKYDPSFIYKINTETSEIENVIKVGAVPKYLAINEVTQKMVVTNWTSSDVSIIDLNTETEIKRVKVGSHPRGVEITKDGSVAYITIMGSTKIAAINMESYDVNYITEIGKSPRHLVLDKSDQFLYCSVNSSNKIVKINLKTDERVSCNTKAGPRTMVLSDNQNYLYVVNYFTDSFQKVDAKTMKVIETVNTGHHPIGITANWKTSEIWVACYEGKIQIFKDELLAAEYSRAPELLASSLLLRGNEIVEEGIENIAKVIIEKEEITVVKESLITPKIKGMIHYNSTTYLLSKKNKVQSVKKIIDEVIIENKKNYLVLDDKINSSKCKYHLIIGSFSVDSNAEKLKQKMKIKGYSAQLIQSANNKMTMVSIQCFESESKANSAKGQILNDSKQSGWLYGG